MFMGRINIVKMTLLQSNLQIQCVRSVQQKSRSFEPQGKDPYLIWRQSAICFTAPNIRLIYFSSSVLVMTEIWNDGLKGLKQQTSYNSVQLRQTDLYYQTLPRHGSRLTPRVIKKISLGFPLFILPISSFWLCPVQKQGLYPPPIKRGNASRHMLKTN